MFKLKQCRSYLWLFPVFCALFFGGFAVCGLLGNYKWGIVILPTFLAGLLSSEVSSGIALDSWWRASHPRGSWQYLALVAWHTLGFVLFVFFAYFFIR